MLLWFCHTSYNHLVCCSEQSPGINFMLAQSENKKRPIFTTFRLSISPKKVFFSAEENLAAHSKGRNLCFLLFSTISVYCLNTILQWTNRAVNHVNYYNSQSVKKKMAGRMTHFEDEPNNSEHVCNLKYHVSMKIVGLKNVIYFPPFSSRSLSQLTSNISKFLFFLKRIANNSGLMSNPTTKTNQFEWRKQINDNKSKFKNVKELLKRTAKG